MTPTPAVRKERTADTATARWAPKVTTERAASSIAAKQVHAAYVLDHESRIGGSAGEEFA
jgi:hypothetical protein